MRAFTLALLIGSTLALGACTRPGAPDDATRLESSAGERAAPAGQADPASAQPGAAATAAQPPKGPIEDAPPMSDPLPPEPLPTTGARAPVLDRSCRTSADCEVKNVGNCCGQMPACVNRNSPTDPAAVQAECAREGRMGVCGFKDVSACECVAGTCQDAGGAIAQ